MAPGGNNHRDDTGAERRSRRPPGRHPPADPRPRPRPSAGIYNDFGYFFVTGTSQATPHVAALAALLYHQGITKPEAIKAAIEQTAEDLGAPAATTPSATASSVPSLALKGLGLNIP